MKVWAFAMSSIVLAAGACDIGARRPLMTVDQTPDTATPDSTPARPDAAADAPHVATEALDAGPNDPACWSAQLPAQARPLSAHASVDVICATDPTATTWGTPPTSSPNDDGRATIVGRWAACGAATSFPAGPHSGVEFGANGRWRLLALDASGTLVPSTAPGSTGYYYLLGSGQIDVMGEDPGGPIHTAFVQFASAMDAVRFSPSSGSSSTPAYARTTPSPANGNDNLPSVSDGTCSMVGTWDLPANANPPGAPAATFSFDGAGNFVGGPLGSDLCVTHTMYGTYRLSPGMFQLTSNVGLGQCQWWFTAGYPAAFAPDCSSVTLTQKWDNCTGGRGYFNQVTTMTRRP